MSIDAVDLRTRDTEAAPDTTAARSHHAWSSGSFLGFDTETTGIDVDHDRIITAALVLATSDGPETITWLIDPGVPIPAAATAVHGITSEQARTNGSQPAVALADIAAVAATALAAGIPVVAFNAQFDLRILDAELARHELPTLAERLGHPAQPIIDPLVIDRAVEPRRRGKRTLADLCRRYEVSVPAGLHNADVDAHMALAVLAAIVARNPKLEAMSLDELHDWQADRHCEWAASMNEWLAGCGRTPDADPSWP